MSRTWPAPPVENTILIIGDTHFGEFHDGKAQSILNDLSDPMVPDLTTPIFHIGDVTEDGLATEDTTALAWLNQLPRDWYALVGNHDTLSDGRSMDTAAQAWGQASADFTVDVGFAKVICLSSKTNTVTLARRNWLDTELGNTEKDCLVLCHYPLNDTVLGGAGEFQSTDANFYLLESAEIRTILGVHDNARAWIAGHTHTQILEPTLMTSEVLGGHTVAFITVPAPVYSSRNGRQLGDPVPSIFVTLTDDEITVRCREHGGGVWTNYGATRFQTVAA